MAWGRLSRQKIGGSAGTPYAQVLLRSRAPYVAARAASPLASRMLEATLRGPRLTVLVGHDTNITDLGGLLDLHWKVPSYPRDNPPPGGALGFEVLSDARGNRFVRAFYRSQTMDQVRELQPLSAANSPFHEYCRFRLRLSARWRSLKAWCVRGWSSRCVASLGRNSFVGDLCWFCAPTERIAISSGCWRWRSVRGELLETECSPAGGLQPWRCVHAQVQRCTGAPVLTDSAAASANASALTPSA